MRANLKAEIVAIVNEIVDKKLAGCAKEHKEILEDAVDGVLKHKNKAKAKKIVKDLD